MFSRLILGIVPFGLTLLPCASLGAQSTPSGQPTPSAQSTPSTQSAPSAQDPAKQVADLEAEKARLQKEIEFAKRRVAGVKDLLKGNLGKREPTWRAIEAGKTTIAQPSAPPMAPRAARLMLDDERSTNPGDVMLLVNGNPIRQAQFDQLIEYQNVLPGDEQAASIRGQMAIADLIRIETMATVFPSRRPR